MEVSLIV